MIGLVLTLCFPLLMGTGFAFISALLAAVDPQQVPEVLARHGGKFYFGFLLIPLVAVLLEAAYDGRLEELRLQLPAIAGLDPWLALLIGSTAAIVTGVLLYYHELYLSVTIKRLTRRIDRRFNTLIEGGAPSLRKQHTSFGLYMLLSAGVAFAEEVIWRGFLTSFLVDRFDLPLYAALAIAATLFGFNHIYFGLRNVALKTIDGLVWGLLMFATSSVLLSFVSHLTFQYFVWQRMARQQLREARA